MNSKELMIKTLSGERTDRISAAPHWWGMYKYQLAGLADDYGAFRQPVSGNVMELADVDALFYETFKPDWFQLGGGPCRTCSDNYRLKKIEELKEEVRSLESMAIIDEFVDLSRESADTIRESGAYDHVKTISGKYGDDVFIALNEGNPIGSILDPGGLIGFENGLIALIEKPEKMEHLVFRQYDAMLEIIKVLKEFGCHGYIGSETYCSPDLISPQTYKDIIYPAQKYFYEKVKEIGVIPIVYFLGDVNPLMEYINELRVDALMVEESKKGFILDVVEIRKKLREDITLFGNLDSVYTLLHSAKSDVVRETRAQLEASKYGRFIMSNGCPIAFNTPAENIKAMIETTWEYIQS